jgi:hypothetical protein
MDFATTLDVLAKLGAFVAGLVAVIVAPAAFLQLRASIRIERERRTLEACRSFHTDPTLCDIKRQIYRARMSEEPDKALREIKREVSNYLNFLESLCIGIEQGIYDEKIVFDNLSNQFFSAVDYFIDRHPRYNPDGNLVTKQNYQPLSRVHRDFKELELGLRAPTTYRSNPSNFRASEMRSNSRRGRRGALRGD